MRTNVVAVWMVGLVVAVGGCDRSASEPAGEPATGRPSPAAVLPADLFLADAPPDAQAVVAVKTEAEPDSEVVVQGRIGGRADPFVAGRAVFLLTDVRLPTCAQREGDTCRQPWDYCCEPAEKILAHTMTVQVVDATGKPLEANLRGAGGLEPMARVVVKGKVSRREAGGVFVVDAHGIHVKAE